MRSVRRTSLVEEVRSALRDHILSGSVAPGSVLNIDGLARTFEVSITPVREALNVLVAEGLVTRRPNQGFRVAPAMTRAEFERHLELRLILEPAAAGLAARRRDPEGLAEIRAALEAYPEGCAPVDAVDARNRSESFHRAIARATGNPLVAEVIEHNLRRAHSALLPFRTTGERHSRREHARLAAAIRRGDAERAEGLMRRHIEETARAFRRSLPDDDSEAATG